MIATDTKRVAGYVDRNEWFGGQRGLCGALVSQSCALRTRGQNLQRELRLLPNGNQRDTARQELLRLRGVLVVTSAAGRKRRCEQQQRLQRLGRH